MTGWDIELRNGLNTMVRRLFRLNLALYLVKLVLSFRRRDIFDNLQPKVSRSQLI